MITSHLMCVTSLGIKILQLLCYNLFNNNKEALAKHVTWKNHSVIVKFRILRISLNRKRKFVTEVLIFRRSHSQMFFKISVIKNFAIRKLCLIELCLSCSPSFAEHLRQLLLDFRGSKYLFQLNLVCIGVLEYELNFRSSHCSCSAKNVFLEIL